MPHMPAPLGTARASGPACAPALAVQGLSCRRGDRMLFRRLNLQLQHGDMLHVTGPNGSGKTSLLRLLAGLMVPTTGRVHWPPARESVGRPAPSRLWIGHAAAINGLLTPHENLAWLGALHGKVCRAACLHALESVGLLGFENQPCHSLSAGQQRRVALARLYLAQDAYVWILDEPFTSLDKQAVAQLEERLARHCTDGGVVVLTSHHQLAHRPSTFRELDLGQYAA